MPTIISEEKVKERAYEIYLERGGFDGNDMGDWFKAEDELLQGKKTDLKKKKKNINSRK